MDSHRLTRRQLLQVTGVIAGYRILSVPATHAQEPTTELGGVPAAEGILVEEQEQDWGPGVEVVTGVIERIELPGTVVLYNGETTITVCFLQGATFRHGFLEHVSDITPFVTGDEVAVAGYLDGGVFQGMSLTSLGREIEAQVIRSRGNLIETARGVVERTAKTMEIDGDEISRRARLVARPLPPLRGGESLIAEVWRDPASGNFIAHKIGLKTIGAREL
ncbi:MAG TPA: hypothetical protein VF707_19370 [Ardenticatenaceae bacterium]